MIEKDFVTEGLKRTRIDEYLENELERAGYGGMEIQVTPLGTMVVVYAERPGMVIGRGGKTVRSITQSLKTSYGLDNPQVEVKEVDIPELNPKIMAHKIAAMLQRGMHFRRVAYTALRRIMGAGAQGVEVTISGKIRGSRSACAKFSDGYIKKCGEPSIRFVRHGFATVQLKPGVLGINVRIMPPDVVLPDKVDILHIEIEEPVTEKSVEIETTPDKIETVESVVEDIVEETEEEVADVEIIEEATDENDEVSEETEIVEPVPAEKITEKPTIEETPVEETSEKPETETTEDTPVKEETEETSEETEDTSVEDESKPENEEEPETQEASKKEENTEKGDKSE